MRPYFAIIGDSFRSAFASRVLYVLLALILLFLAALAPFYVTEGLDWKLSMMQNLNNPPRLARQLAERSQQVNYPEVKLIWERLDEDLQNRLLEFQGNSNDADATEDDQAKADPGPKEGEVTVTVQGDGAANSDGEPPRGRRNRGNFNFFSDLVDGLNEVISGDSLYDEEIWKGKRLNDEIRNLAENEASLTEEQQRRLNRLLVGVALPSLSPPAPTSQTVNYAMFELYTFSISRQTFQLTLTDALAYILDKFVLTAGLFIGILVTANIIPETFDPGSLNLLLSKPITRWGLYVTKFIGGCVLIAICSVLLFTGLWLWMGLAIGIWEVALLWSIPVYILVFAIYFSVSSSIGLLFRSSIMAIVVTGVFWAACWAVGSGYGFLNARMENNRIYDVAQQDDWILAQDGWGQLVTWNAEQSRWDVTAKASPGGGPENPESVLEGVSWFGKLKQRPFRLTPEFDGSGGAYVGLNFLLDMPMESHQGFYYSPGKDRGFRRVGFFPRDAMASFGTKDGLLVVNRQGQFLKLDATRLQEADLPEQDAKPKAKVAKPSGKQDIGQPESDQDAEKWFRDVGPENAIRVGQTYAVAYNESNEEVAIHEYKDGKNRIYVFKNNNGVYKQDRSVQFDLGTSQRIKCFVAYQGNTIVIVAGNGQVIALASDTLKEIKGYLPETRFPIETLAGSPDGRWFALAYADQRVWILDTQDDQEIRLANVTGQGSISSVSFNQQSELWVVDSQNRATKYAADTLSYQESVDDFGGVLEGIYRYAVAPLYYVFPKPGEFYKVVQYLSSTRDTSVNESVDLIETEVAADPFAPLYSGLAFMIVMLTISCTIFHFKDY